MAQTTTIVLPGLDGTDLLLDRFRRAAPPTHSVMIRPLPDAPCGGYPYLVDYISPTLEETVDCVLIGESFSGPLAVLLAHRHSKVVRHLVLVASFVTSPVPRIAAWLPWALLFRLPIPSLAARLLIGDSAELLPTLRTAVKSQSPRTLANRIAAISTVDVCPQLSELTCPITYIQATHDSLIPATQATKITGLNPNTIVRQIQGPHLILQTRPREAWQQIIQTHRAVGVRYTS